MKLTPITVVLALAITLASCETTINPRLENSERILVIDAWVNQKMVRQEIKVTRSQPYFENTFPANVPGATVFVTDLTSGEIYPFQEGVNAYYWDPVVKPFGMIGNTYELTIIADGERFVAQSELRRVPPVEGIKFTYHEETLVIKQEHYMAEFIASDLPGLGDTYWIKAWKNGNFLNNPTELNVVYDAGFSAGQSVDGTSFIIPIRKNFINPLDKVPGKTNEFKPPYVVGDSVSVEIHSITPIAFDFLYGLYFQIGRTGGFSELFSMPLANVITNITPASETSTTPVAGFFNVAAVSGSGLKLTASVAEEAKRNR